MTRFSLRFGCGYLLAGIMLAPHTVRAADCANPVYLTIDPATMDFAPRLSEVLRRQQVKALFWVSNEPTRNGEGSLGIQWGEWWGRMAAQGHEFASQTYDHVAWRGDAPGYRPVFRMVASNGAFAGREFSYDPPKMCAQIDHAARRIEDYIGKKSLTAFYPPSGHASPKLLSVVRACGYVPMAVAPLGLLDQRAQLKASLAGIRAGDVLLADLHAAAGAEPWALANLEPLIVGLRERGLCFDSVRRHPAYQAWVQSHGG